MRAFWAAIASAALVLASTATPGVATAADAVALAESVHEATSAHRTYSAAERPTWGPLAGTDDLGRDLPDFATAGLPRSERFVGIRYAPWHGQNDPRDYKNVVNLESVLQANPGATSDYDSPLFPDSTHFGYWDEPLLGYYRSDDRWVIRRHLQLLADADVDFIQLDATNDRYFKSQALLIMKEIEEMQREGRKAPQIVFMTHNDSANYMNELYETFYAPAAPYRHPTTWFHFKGKPLIVGEDPSSPVASFFTFRYAQWPNEAQVAGGWDWTSFDELPRVNRNGAGGAEQVAVSVAANSNNPPIFSYADYYGAAGAKSRNYHNGAEDTSDNAIAHGFRFQEEWDHAIAVDPEVVLVEGWNEWSAGNWQNSSRSNQITFYDASSARYSRDVEPVNSDLGDNYYMQMVANIRNFKGIAAPAAPSASQTIDLAGSFSQWSGVTPTYRSYVGAAEGRDYAGTGNVHYTNDSARNVFETAKVARDAATIYFYVQTTGVISARTDNRWMTLLLNVDGDGTNGWKGYDFAVNRGASSASSSRLESSSGGWNWTTVSSSIQYKVLDNELMVGVPMSMLGVGAELSLQFKWVDNWNTDGQVLDFYQYGQSAPYGRMNFVYDTGAPPAYTSESPPPIPAAAVSAPDGAFQIENVDRLTEYNDWNSPARAWITNNSSVNASGGSYASLSASPSYHDPYFISTVSTVFEGDGVKWLTRTAPDGVDQVEVFVDGISHGSVSLRGEGVRDKAVLFEAYGLGAGTHEIVVKCDNRAGTTCYHDAFEYSRGSAAVPPSVQGQNLARSASVSASSFATARWYAVTPPLIGDESLTTEWRASGVATQWVELDFGRAQEFDRVELSPGSTGYANTAYGIQRWSGSAWTDFATGTLGSIADTVSFSRRTEQRIRVNFAATSGAAISVAEVRVLNGMPLVSQGKSATSSSTNPGWPAAAAVDGNAATYWVASGAAMPQWLAVDLGTASSVVQVETQFYANDTWQYRLEGSDDAATWTLLADRTGQPFTGETSKDSVNLRFRYVRVVITGAAANWAAIKELRVYGSVLPAVTALSGTSISATSQNAGYEAAKAVDGSGTTYWCATSGSMPQALTLDLGSTKAVQRVRLDFYAEDYWYYWVEGSKDGTNWRTVASRSGESSQRFTDTVSGSYRWIRIKVVGSGGNWAAVRELVVEGRAN